MRTLVITPTYNERDNIEALSEAVLSVPGELDYLVVDDNSPDGTGDLADEIARKTHRFKVLHRAGKLGLGSAYREAFTVALEQGYDAVISMDGDWSHDPQYLPALVEATARADLVIGSRYLHGISVVNWELSRLIMSTVANQYARLVTGMPFRDCTSGFQCLTRRALESIGLAAIQTSGYSFLIDLKYRVVDAGLTGVEVPIVFTQRRHLEDLSRRDRALHDHTVEDAPRPLGQGPRYGLRAEPELTPRISAGASSTSAQWAR